MDIKEHMEVVDSDRQRVGTVTRSRLTVRPEGANYQ